MLIWKYFHQNYVRNLIRIYLDSYMIKVEFTCIIINCERLNIKICILISINYYKN
jgi:hypothetical protein